MNLLETEIAGIKMENPVMNASGTFGVEYGNFFDLSKMGAIVPKSRTLLPRLGNPPPRVMETAAGMINFIGLQNNGMDSFIEEDLSELVKLGIPVIPSIAGATEEEYVQLTVKLERRKNDIAAIEVNVSCPNVKQGGVAFGQDIDVVRRLVLKLKKETSLPLVIKLTPNCTEIGRIALSAEDAGAGALCLINTVKGRAWIPRGTNGGRWITGGLSGPCIKPIALQKIAEVIDAGVKIPLIGVGGICCVEDALDFFRMGVSAIQIGTANFRNPCVISEIIDGLQEYCNQNQIHISQVRERR